MNKHCLSGICVCLLLSSGCNQETTLVVKPHKDKKANIQAAVYNAALEQQPAEASVKESAPKRENPFLSLEEEEAFKSKKLRVVLNGYVLSAIFYAPPQSKAIINGALFKEGDRLGNKEIVAIESSEVILKDEEGEYSLRLKKLL